MADWIMGIIEGGGYLGIFLLMILENVFPPIPSELVIPFAGFVAARGDLSIIGVMIATTLGGTVGCMPWYFVGRLYGMRRLKKIVGKFGRVLTLNIEDIDHAQAWFQRHGHLAVFFGRLMPTVRSLISVPAGIARMPFGIFVLYSFFGTAIWNMALLFAGYVLESQYDSLAVYIDFFSNAIIVALVSIYVYRVVTYKKTVPVES